MNVFNAHSTVPVMVMVVILNIRRALEGKLCHVPCWLHVIKTVAFKLRKNIEKTIPSTIASKKLNT
jgi:hypothetical protein